MKIKVNIKEQLLLLTMELLEITRLKKLIKVCLQIQPFIMKKKELI